MAEKRFQGFLIFRVKRLPWNFVVNWWIVISSRRTLSLSSESRQIWMLVNSIYLAGWCQMGIFSFTPNIFGEIWQLLPLIFLKSIATEFSWDFHGSLRHKSSLIFSVNMNRTGVFGLRNMQICLSMPALLWVHGGSQGKQRTFIWKIKFFPIWGELNVKPKS